MNRMVAFVLLAGLISACGSGSAILGSGVDQSTPEALFESALRACEDNDLNVCLNLIDEPDRDPFVFTVLLSLTFAPISREMRQEMKDIAARHGVSQDAPAEPVTLDSPAAMRVAAQRILKDVKDKAGLLGDLLALAKKGYQQPKNSAGNIDTVAKAAIGNVKIVGDDATGTVMIGRKPQPMLFMRREGRWYVRGESGGVLFEALTRD